MAPTIVSSVVSRTENQAPAGGTRTLAHATNVERVRVYINVAGMETETTH